MEWLTELYKFHDDWVRMARAYGAGDYAEDCVQDAYIKITRYASKERLFKKGKLDRGYVFLAVKSVVMQHHKTSRHLEELDYTLTDAPQHEPGEYQALWLEIDAHTSKTYPLYRRILYKMWRQNYTIREMNEITEVSTPTIVKELKIIKNDIKENFKEAWEEAKEPRFGRYD